MSTVVLEGIPSGPLCELRGQGRAAGLRPCPTVVATVHAFRKYSDRSGPGHESGGISGVVGSGDLPLRATGPPASTVLALPVNTAGSVAKLSTKLGQRHPDFRLGGGRFTVVRGALEEQPLCLARREALLTTWGRVDLAEWASETGRCRTTGPVSTVVLEGIPSGPLCEVRGQGRCFPDLHLVAAVTPPGNHSDRSEPGHESGGSAGADGSREWPPGASLPRESTVLALPVNTAGSVAKLSTKLGQRRPDFRLGGGGFTMVRGALEERPLCLARREALLTTWSTV